YSLGCTLFTALTGQPPFRGNSLAEKIIKHQQAPPPDLAKLRRDIRPELAALVIRMLAKNPADRVQTPKEVAARLQPFVRTMGPLPPPVFVQDGSGGSTIEEVVWTENRPAAGMAHTARTELMATPVKRRRPVWLWAGGGAAAFFALLVCAGV